ncbi:competence protein CoiA [Cupriavidus pauculus]|uniref:competence protein CoiA n=1 Tax=Cupriavidus pauculus TaxID=82633 RepID=UPI0011AEF252|nr:competence protein CoiA family protein [Cupriavidus pauculus]
MKFSIVNEERREAEPGLAGACPVCAGPMVAKCGEVNTWHWAHKARRACDPWWENEGEWHRAWKNEFPSNWQEVVQIDENGAKHIADVKTDSGWVIELQHSYLNPDERRSRNVFYKKLAWVVDGSRRKTDRKRFNDAWNEGLRLPSNSPVRRVRHDACPIVREWVDTTAPVLFDFGNDTPLWWLLAKGSNGYAYVAPFSRADFVAIHRNGATKLAADFQSLAGELGLLVASYERSLRIPAFGRAPLQTAQIVRRPVLRGRYRGRL